MTVEEKEKMEEVKAQSRQVYDALNHTVNFMNRRVTDLKENAKVYLPRPLSPIEEAELAFRKEKNIC